MLKAQSIVPSGSTIDSPTFTGNHIGDTYPIGQSFVAVNAPSDTNEDTLATITLPANALGNNGAVRIHCSFAYTNSANNKTLKVKFGGTVVWTATRTTNISSDIKLEIGNAGATNSQNAFSVEVTGAGASATQSNTAAIDTTSAVTILITGQKALNTETLTLSMYTAEIIRTTV